MVEPTPYALKVAKECFETLEEPIKSEGNKPCIQVINRETGIYILAAAIEQVIQMEKKDGVL